MANEIPINDITLESTCIVCGKEFVPQGTDLECCSPMCRTMRIVMGRSSQQKHEMESIKDLSRPPKMDTRKNPKARAEWFMSIPATERGRFLKFLNSQELIWIKEMEQKRLSEDWFYSGFFVKKGKIVDVKAKGETEEDAFFDNSSNQTEEGEDED